MLACVGAVTLSLDLPASFLDRPGQRAGFVALAAFLASFLFIRTSARLNRSPRVPWWPGSVSTSGGLHLHHLVWGIVLILMSGFLGFAVNAVSPWNEVLAALFGIGAGLTLDEFALWVYLKDVYWAEEGRASFDAVVVAALLGGLVVLGVAPFDVRGNTSSLTTLFTAVTIDVPAGGRGDPQGQAAARPRRRLRPLRRWSASSASLLPARGGRGASTGRVASASGASALEPDRRAPPAHRRRDRGNADR